VERIVSEIAAVLRMPVGRVEPTRALTQLGLDSLMALELKSRLQRGLGLTVTVQQLLKAPSVEELAEELAGSGAARP
jgi:acyl carrier protein